MRSSICEQFNGTCQFRVEYQLQQRESIYLELINDTTQDCTESHLMEYQGKYYSCYAQIKPYNKYRYSYKIQPQGCSIDQFDRRFYYNLDLMKKINNKPIIDKPGFINIKYRLITKDQQFTNIYNIYIQTENQEKLKLTHNRTQDQNLFMNDVDEYIPYNDLKDEKQKNKIVRSLIIESIKTKEISQSRKFDLSNYQFNIYLNSIYIEFDQQFFELPQKLTDSLIFNQDKQQNKPQNIQDDDLYYKLQQYQQEIDQKNKQIDENNKERNEYYRKINEKQSLIDQLQIQNQKNQQEIKGLQQLENLYTNELNIIKGNFEEEQKRSQQLQDKQNEIQKKWSQEQLQFEECLRNKENMLKDNVKTIQDQKQILDDYKRKQFCLENSHMQNIYQMVDIDCNKIPKVEDQQEWNNLKQQLIQTIEQQNKKQDELQNTLKVQETQLNIYQKKEKDLKVEADQLDQEYTELIKQMEKKEQERKKTINQIEQNNKQLKSKEQQLQKEIDKLDSESNNLKLDNKQLKSKEQQLKEEIDKLDSDSQNLKNKMKQKEEELMKLQKELEQYKRKEKELIQQIDDLESESEKYKQQSKQLYELIKSIRSQLSIEDNEDIIKKLENYQQNIQEQNIRIDKYIKQIQSLKQKIKELKKDNKQLKKILEKNKKQSEEEIKFISESKQQLETEMKETEERQKKYQQEQQQKQKLQQEKLKTNIITIQSDIKQIVNIEVDYVHQFTKKAQNQWINELNTYLRDVQSKVNITQDEINQDISIELKVKSEEIRKNMQNSFEQIDFKEFDKGYSQLQILKKQIYDWKEELLQIIEKIDQNEKEKFNQIINFIDEKYSKIHQIYEILKESKQMLNISIVNSEIQNTQLNSQISALQTIVQQI